jgi:hypothetical protein
MSNRWLLILAAVTLVPLTVVATQGRESFSAAARRCALPTLRAGKQCWSAFQSSRSCLATAGSGNPMAFLACPWAGFEAYHCVDQGRDAWHCWNDEPVTRPGASDALLETGQAARQYGRCIQAGSKGSPSALVECPLASYRGWNAGMSAARAANAGNTRIPVATKLQGAQSACADQVASFWDLKASARPARPAPKR